jgi:hypothetical protein
MKVQTVSKLALGAAILGAGILVMGAQSGPTTIRVVERATTDATVDLGTTGDSIGDTLAFANAVYDAANKVQVGTDQGMCTRTIPGKAYECNWTLSLKDGQITVEGPFLDAGDSVLSITGGTGAYASARGQMKLHARDAKGSEYDFTYELR